MVEKEKKSILDMLLQINQDNFFSKYKYDRCKNYRKHLKSECSKVCDNYISL